MMPKNEVKPSQPIRAYNLNERQSNRLGSKIDGSSERDYSKINQKVEDTRKNIPFSQPSILRPVSNIDSPLK